MNLSVVTAGSPRRLRNIVSAIVADPVPSFLTVAPTPFGVTVGGTVTLTATVYDQYGGPMTGQTVDWATSNGSVATVNSSGVVTGQAAGSCSITASVVGYASLTTPAACTVSAAAVATLDVTPSTLVVTEGGASGTVTFTPRDAGGNALSGRTVTGTSNATGTATISLSGYTGTVAPVAAGSTTVYGTCEGVDSSTVSVTVGAAGGALNPNMPGSVTSYEERFWNAQNDAAAPGSLATEGGWYDSTAHTWPQVVSTSDSTLVSDMTSGQIASLYKGSNNTVGKSQFTGSGDGTSPTLASFQNGSSSGFNSDEVYASIVFAPSLNWDHITSYKLFQFSTHTPGTGANTRVGVVVHLRANQSSKFGDTTTPITLDLVISVNTSGGTTEVRAASGTITRGSANHAEIYIKLNTNGSNDGICKMWFNGTLVMNQSALGFRGGSATILGGDKFYLVNLYSSKGGPTTTDTIAAPCRLYYGYTGIGWA